MLFFKKKKNLITLYKTPPFRENIKYALCYEENSIKTNKCNNY